MGAIGGIIDLGGKHISEKQGLNMVNVLKNYKLNDIIYLYYSNIYMVAGIQYITEESYSEVLPKYDSENNIIFTADAIIDNRSELIHKLGMNYDSEKVITDSDIILKAYLKWGEKSPEYLIGDFAYAIWDINKEVLHLVRNHTGTRTLYYAESNGKVYFSTLLNQIIKTIDNEIELNERWVCDYLSLNGPAHEVEVNETMYSGIYQVPPATCISFHKENKFINCYWNPLKLDKIKLKSDKEYIERFLEIFEEAVNCKLRSTKEIGIMISGGLDSSSVGVMAAKKLKKSNKDLLAYTSVPKKGYKDNPKSHKVGDERSYVETIEDMYDNIKINYKSYEDINSYDVINDVTEYLEQPFKFVENIYWSKSILEDASRDGCRVLLNGQFGNSTISYGEFTTHILTEFKNWKFIRLYKHLNRLASLQGVSRKLLMRIALRVICPYKIRELFYKLFRSEFNFMNNLIVNKELSKEYDVLNRFKSMGFFNYPVKYRDITELRNIMMNPIVFSHIGAIETKLSLANGIVERDPTRDKRIIEFCMNIPENQFVCNGYDRNLIRRAMEGILPDKIRLNIDKRGLQAVDWVIRLKKDWNKISSELLGYFTDDRIKRYIEVDKVKRDLLSIEGEITENTEEAAVRNVILTLVFSRFIIKNTYPLTSKIKS